VEQHTLMIISENDVG